MTINTGEWIKSNSLKVVYAIQNVGGIDFSQDVGDTVPVKYTLLGLRKAGYHVSCLKLRGHSVVGIDDISQPDQVWNAPLGISGKRSFMFFESAVRRLQRILRIPYFAFFDAYRFFEACSRCLPDYHLCHEHNGLFCIGAALACSRLRIPYILTFSADPLLERALLKRPLRGLHGLVASTEAKYTYQLAKKIICVSEPAKRHLVKTWQVLPEKVEVLPNGVDTELFKPAENPQAIRSGHGFGDEPVIGFVGGFQPWHGLDLLVESFALVLKEFPQAKLLLIGDGRARPMVDRKVQEFGVESSVIITGLMPQARVPDLLSIVDVAVLPYPKLPEELWFSPLKLYEYMASGKAIVASRAGQIAEVIQHESNGLLVEPADVKDLAQAIIWLLRSPEERIRLGCNARRKAIEEHSWERYIQHLEEIYLSVVN